jgi:hypothetical protein
MSTLEMIGRINDLSVLHDLINHNILSVTHSKLSLDECIALLPLLRSLLQMQDTEEYIKSLPILPVSLSPISIQVSLLIIILFFRYISSALKMLREIMRVFGPVFKSRDSLGSDRVEDSGNLYVEIVLTDDPKGSCTLK